MLRAHADFICDFDWSPFSDTILASSGDAKLGRCAARAGVGFWMWRRTVEVVSVSEIGPVLPGERDAVRLLAVESKAVRWI